MNDLPLLMLCEGRTPRLRKARLERPLELALHLGVAKLLRNHARPEWRWSHFPAGEARDARTGARLKAMGLQRGWPDFILVSPSGLLHALELKRIGETLSEDQEAFAAWCTANGVPHCVVRTMEEALGALDRWGVLRIRLAAAFRSNGSAVTEQKSADFAPPKMRARVRHGVLGS